MKWFAIIFIAVVVETLTENIKNVFPAFANKKWAVMLATVVLGVVTAFAVQADIITAVGLTSQIPYLGFVMTGVLAAGGSNYVYDLINKIQGGKEKATELDADYIKPVVENETHEVDE